MEVMTKGHPAQLFPVSPLDMDSRSKLYKMGYEEDTLPNAIEGEVELGEGMVQKSEHRHRQDLWIHIDADTMTAVLVGPAQTILEVNTSPLPEDVGPDELSQYAEAFFKANK